MNTANKYGSKFNNVVELATSSRVIASSITPQKKRTPASENTHVVFGAYLNALLKAKQAANPAEKELAEQEADTLFSMLKGPLSQDQQADVKLIATLSAYPKTVNYVYLLDTQVRGADTGGWTRYEGPRGGKGWKHTSGRIVYNADENAPGAGRRKIAANQDRARNLSDKVLAHFMDEGSESPSEEELHELAGHLPSLTVDHLKSVRNKLFASWPNRSRKLAMIQALSEHVAGLVRKRQETGSLRDKAVNQEEWEKANAKADAKGAKSPEGIPAAATPEAAAPDAVGPAAAVPEETKAVTEQPKPAVPERPISPDDQFANYQPTTPDAPKAAGEDVFSSYQPTPEASPKPADDVFAQELGRGGPDGQAGKKAEMPEAGAPESLASVVDRQKKDEEPSEVAKIIAAHSKHMLPKAVAEESHKQYLDEVREHESRVKTMRSTIERLEEDYKTATPAKKRSIAAELKAVREQFNEALDKSYDFRYSDHSRDLELNLLAHNKNAPEFQRAIAAISLNKNYDRFRVADESHPALTKSAESYLREQGHDPRIAGELAAYLSRNPLEPLDRLIRGETNKQSHRDEQQRAKDWVSSEGESMGMSPEHRQEAYREAEKLYQGDFDDFVRKHTNKAEANFAANQKQKELEKQRSDQDEAERKRAEQAKSAVLHYRSTGEVPANTSSDALHGLVKEHLAEHHRWRPVDESNLPKNSETDIANSFLSNNNNSKYAMSKAITEQGWATDAKYAVKATPQMIEMAKAKGVDQMEGRAPNIASVLPRGKGEEVRMIAKRTGTSEQVPSVVLEGASGNRMVVEQKFLGNIFSLYPGATLQMHRNLLTAHKDGETVGLIMPIDKGGDLDKIRVDTFPQFKLSDVLEPSPYGEEEIDKTYQGFRQKATGARVSVNGNRLPDYDMEFPSNKEAENAAKSILAHTHGADEDGRPILKPKGQGTEISPEAATKRDYYAAIRDHVDKTKIQRKEKVTLSDERGEYERENHHLDENWAVRKSGREYNGKDKNSWDLVHTPSGAIAGSWRLKDDAIGHHGVVTSLPIDWNNFEELKKNNPEEYQRQLKIFNNATNAFKDSEYHPDMGMIAKKEAPVPATKAKTPRKGKKGTAATVAIDSVESPEHKAEVAKTMMQGQTPEKREEIAEHVRETSPEAAQIMQSAGVMEAQTPERREETAPQGAVGKLLQYADKFPGEPQLKEVREFLSQKLHPRLAKELESGSPEATVKGLIRRLPKVKKAVESGDTKSLDGLLDTLLAHHIAFGPDKPFVNVPNTHASLKDGGPSNASDRSAAEPIREQAAPVPKADAADAASPEIAEARAKAMKAANKVDFEDYHMDPNEDEQGQHVADKAEASRQDFISRINMANTPEDFERIHSDLGDHRSRAEANGKQWTERRDQREVPASESPAEEEKPSSEKVQKTLKEAYDHLCLFVEFRDKLVELPRLYHEAKKRMPSLTTEQFHDELTKMNKDWKVDLQFINEVHMAEQKHLGIHRNDRLYYYARWMNQDEHKAPEKTEQQKQEEKKSQQRMTREKSQTEHQQSAKENSTRLSSYGSQSQQTEVYSLVHDIMNKPVPDASGGRKQAMVHSLISQIQAPTSRGEVNSLISALRSESADSLAAHIEKYSGSKAAEDAYAKAEEISKKVKDGLSNKDETFAGDPDLTGHYRHLLRQHSSGEKKNDVAPDPVPSTKPASPPDQFADYQPSGEPPTPEPVASEPEQEAARTVPDVNDLQVVTESRDGKNQKVLSWGFRREIAQRINSGDMTAAELRAHFDALTADPRKVKAAISDALKKTGMRSPDKIRAAAGEIYDRALSTLTPGKTFMYEMGPNWEQSKIDGHRRAVQEIDDEHLKQHAENVRAETESRKQRIQQFKNAIDNPQTPDDFRALIRARGETALTPEQGIKWDELQAKERRDKDAATRAKNAAVSGFKPGEEATGGVGIVEGHHQKRDVPTFTVTVENRLGDDGFSEVLSRAKQLGGSYVNARIAKAYGATPGFQFFDKAKAEQFAAVLRGESVDRSADVAQTEAERLANRAAGLGERADSIIAGGEESLSRDRLANTARRAAQAASAEADARQQIATGRTLASLSQAMAGGTVQHLNQVRSAKDVDTLNRTLNRAQYDRVRAMKLPYDKHQDELGKPHTEEDVREVKYPYPQIWSDDLKKAAEAMKDEPGLMRVAQKLAKAGTEEPKFRTRANGFALSGGRIVTAQQIAAEHLELAEAIRAEMGPNADKAFRVHASYDTRLIKQNPGPVYTADEGKTWGTSPVIAVSAARRAGNDYDLVDGPSEKLLSIDSPDDLEAMRKVVSRLRNHSSRDLRRIGESFGDRLEHYNRLQRMDIKTPAELRAALREYLPLKQGADSEDPVKKLERGLIGRKIDGFFPTPRKSVDDMLDRADIQQGMSVLEPSAGKGDILDAINERHPDAQTHAIEPVGDLRRILQAKGHNLVDSDFLAHQGQYDRVIMNPPFEDGQDIDHVRHAYDQLKPGGKLVAIMSEGPFFRGDKKASGFREWLDSVDGEHEQMEEGSFAGKDAFRQTGVRTRMVTISKPEGEQTSQQVQTGTETDMGTATESPPVEHPRDRLGRLRGMIPHAGAGGGFSPQKGEAVATAGNEVAAGKYSVVSISRDGTKFTIRPDRDTLTDDQRKLLRGDPAKYDRTVGASEVIPPSHGSRAKRLAGIVGDMDTNHLGAKLVMDAVESEFESMQSQAGLPAQEEPATAEPSGGRPIDFATATADEIDAHMDGFRRKPEDDAQTQGEKSKAYGDALRSMPQQVASEYINRRQERDNRERRSRAGTRGAETRSRNEEALAKKLATPTGKRLHEAEQKVKELGERYKIGGAVTDSMFDRAQRELTNASLAHNLYETHKEPDVATQRRNDELPTLNVESGAGELEATRSMNTIPWTVSHLESTAPEVISGAELRDDVMNGNGRILHLYGIEPGTMSGDSQTAVRGSEMGTLLVHFDKGDPEQSARARRLVSEIARGKAQNMTVGQIRQLILTGKHLTPQEAAAQEYADSAAKAGQPTTKPNNPVQSQVNTEEERNDGPRATGPGTADPERGEPDGTSSIGQDGGVTPGAASFRPRVVDYHAGHTKRADPGVLPESVRKHLSEEQLQGAALAVSSMDKSGGALNADGTGVGKTRQQLAIAETYAQRGHPVLIVAPKRVLGADFKKGQISGSFKDDASTMGLGLTLTKGETPLQPGKIHVSTYENLSKLKGQIDPSTVVLFDESHKMKNSTSATSKHGNEITTKAKAVGFFTATPGDKALHIGHLERAGVYGTIGRKETLEKLGMELHDQHIGGGEYRKVWRASPQVKSEEVVRRLAGLRDQMIKDGLMIRRELSMDGVKFSPDHVMLSNEQNAEMQKVYNDVLKATDNKAVALMAARMHQEHMKIPHVVEQIKNDLAAGRKPIVFAGRVNAVGEDGEPDEEDDEIKQALAKTGHSSPGTIPALKQALIDAGVPEEHIAELHGAAKEKQEKAIDRFQSGNAKIMLATIQSGGTGVNLDDRRGDAPRSVHIMTPPLTANDMSQAIGRVHRMTTRSPSNIHAVLSDHFIDHWNAKILRDKFANMGALVGGESDQGSNLLGENPLADVAEDREPFDWGESLLDMRHYHNTPAVHNDILHKYNAKRVIRNGDFTTEFKTKEDFDRYQEENKTEAPVTSGTTSGPPFTRAVKTQRGERHVYSFSPGSSFWDTWKKWKSKNSKPDYLSVGKDDRTGDWNVAVWGETPEEVKQNLKHLEAQGVNHPMIGKPAYLATSIAEVVEWGPIVAFEMVS